MRANLRAHQLMMLDMLEQIDAICGRHGISYVLFAGTLLGAVRHQGFIPWDDDADVLMLRPDYERFLAVAQEELDHEKYFLQREFSAHWPMFFSKLRRNGTTCLERYVPKDYDTHMGVYVDIFPCDNLSDNAATRRAQFLASKVIIAKSLDRRGYVTGNPAKRAALVASRAVPGAPLTNLVQNRPGSATRMVHTFLAASRSYEKNVFPREWLQRTTRLEFEGRSFSVPLSYDGILTQLYGDYLVPTPPERRGEKVHGEIVDLERPYTEYREAQRNLRFRELSRSIR